MTQSVLSTIYKTFFALIASFNAMYKLPANLKPSLDVGEPAADRLRSFKSILGEELDEIDDIIAAIEAGKPDIDVLTMLADLLGDINVYCASEATKFGLPLEKILQIIMASNFSKLGSDGQPIYDARGKVQKGPLYWKPEPRIAEMLAAETGAPSAALVPVPLDVLVKLLSIADHDIDDVETGINAGLYAKADNEDLDEKRVARDTARAIVDANTK